MVGWISKKRGGGHFDVVIEGETRSGSEDDWSGIVAPWVDAGAAWWLESMWGYMRRKDADAEFLRRVRLGPTSVK